MATQSIKQCASGIKEPNGAKKRRNEIDCPVTDALRNSARGGMWCVKCEFREGLAILYGKVTSYYLKQLAQETAKSVEGVELVINRVDVPFQK